MTVCCFQAPQFAYRYGFIGYSSWAATLPTCIQTGDDLDVLEARFKSYGNYTTCVWDFQEQRVCSGSENYKGNPLIHEATNGAGAAVLAYARNLTKPLEQQECVKPVSFNPFQMVHVKGSQEFLS